MREKRDGDLLPLWVAVLLTLVGAAAWTISLWMRMKSLESHLNLEYRDGKHVEKGK